MCAESEKLWLQIRPVLEDCSTKVMRKNPKLIRSFGNTQNETYFLRAYLAFRNHNDGDELAVTADVMAIDDKLTIATDICYGEGQILADGPSVVFAPSDLEKISGTALDNWLAEFRQFLATREDEILAITSKL